MFGNSNRILRHCTIKNKSCRISTVCKTHKHVKNIYKVVLDLLDMCMEVLRKDGK